MTVDAILDGDENRNAGRDDTAEVPQNAAWPVLPEPGDPTGIGMRVRVHGLNSAPQYNDTFGTIEKADANSGRWEIRLAYDDSLKKLKNKNLEAL